MPSGHLSWFFSLEIVTVQGGYGTRFCHHGGNKIELYEYRGTELMGGQGFITVQN
jgi:hypothetical protein